MASNVTNLTDLLKNIYGPYLARQQNLSHMSYDMISKSSRKYNAGGKGFFGGINDSGNESVGAINEEEQFRTIDNESYMQFKVIPKINVAPIQFSGLLAESANDSPEAFADAVVDALDMAKERLMKDCNRQFFGLGTGVLCSPGGTVSSSATSFSVDSAQYLRKNQVVDIFSAVAGTKLVDSYRIQDVDKSANVVYFSTQISVSITAGNVMVKENSQDSAPSDGKEMIGLRGIIDDATEVTTFENLSAATTRIWRAVRIDASSANLTSDLLQRLLDDVRVLSGEDPDLLLMHQKQRRKYLDIVVPQKRYMDDKMDAGHSKLSFNGIDLILDEDCQVDTVYAVNKKHLQKYEVLPLSLGKHDGSDTYLRIANYDTYQAYWRMYANFGADKRNCHGKIIGLAKPTGVS